MIQFTPKHTHIVCIDSDGTAMDTMTIKHERCFGPCFVEEWGLQASRESVLKRWNEINLYEKTRGKNRFITLLQILKELNCDVDALDIWVNSGAELSNNGLKKAIEETDSSLLKKALRWSESTNRAISALKIGDKKPFAGVSEFFRYAQGKVDIAVVSSANAAAIEEEWGYYGLLCYLDVVTSQEDGTKKECIAELLKKGYLKQNVILLGDALSDKKAADDCGVYFYPILIGREQESWNRFQGQYLDEFLSGSFAKSARSLQERFVKQFEKN